MRVSEAEGLNLRMTKRHNYIDLGHPGRPITTHEMETQETSSHRCG
jgi:hypothetical protein